MGITKMRDRFGPNSNLCTKLNAPLLGGFIYKGDSAHKHKHEHNTQPDDKNNTDDSTGHVGLGWVGGWLC